MLNFKTVQARLFFTYSLIIVIIVALMVTYFYYYTSSILGQNASNSMRQSATYISGQLDATVQDLDNTAVKIIYATSLKDLFFQEIDPGNETALLNNQRQINEIVFSILGPIKGNWQLNLIDLKGRFVGVGDYSVSSYFTKSKLSSISWISETQAADGGRFISSPRKDDWNDSSREVVSLSRAFATDLGAKPRGIVEVQQDYSSIKNLIETIVSNPGETATNHKSVYVFDNNGSLVYPLDLVARAESRLYWSQVKSLPNSLGSLNFTNTDHNTSEIMAYNRSSYSGWTVVIAESEESLLGPVTVFRNSIAVAVVILLLITLAISFYVATRLTAPIKKMHNLIKSRSLEMLVPTLPKETMAKLNELELIDVSFNEMSSHLVRAIEETILSRSHEVQARMAALQAQMNPHFLYNTITIISVMAEESGQDKIVQMCNNLSRMLRYILSNSFQQTTIADELEYARSYLQLMQTRYDGMLEYTINVEDVVRAVQVPKLIVQPIVENCMKYGIHVAPPWKIELTGRCEGNSWFITIRDYGEGFTSQALRTLNETTEAVMQVSVLEDRERVKGMGLKNIVARLNLLYGEASKFEATNHPDGGACITIGGLINYLDSSTSAHSTAQAKV